MGCCKIHAFFVVLISSVQPPLPLIRVAAGSSRVACVVCGLVRPPLLIRGMAMFKARGGDPLLSEGAG